MFNAPPWWLSVRCECRIKPLPDPVMVGQFWFCDICGQRYRLMHTAGMLRWGKS